MTETPANYPIFFAGLEQTSGRRKADGGVQFAKALVALNQFEAEGLLTKTDHDWLKVSINNDLEHAFSALFSEPYVNAGRYESLPREVYDLYYSVSWPACHLLIGKLRKLNDYQNKIAKGSMPDHEMVGKMHSFFAEVAPLGARVVALKEKIGKRAPKQTKTSIAEAERAALAMTCQCCGGDVLANTGVIAHHGYQRPGQGWQTASCPGARELPFEVDREALGRYIEGVKAFKLRTEMFRQSVIDEKLPLRWTFQDLSTRINAWTKLQEMTVSVTRETFAEVAAETEAKRRKVSPETTFDSLKARTIAGATAEIHSAEAEIARQTIRYNGWKQTHRREGDAWVAL